MHPGVTPEFQLRMALTPVRTLVSTQSEDIIKYFQALGFAPSPIQALEKSIT